MYDLYFLCAVWKLGFIFDIACSFPFASAYPTNKSSVLTKGIVSPLQTLLVCYWSVSEHCWQNLFITNSSTFAQNVIHALITLSLDYCRSFFYSHPKSLPSKFQDSWLVSYSGEQSYQLPLPSFSWLTFYGSTRVKIALWISERFMVLLQPSLQPGLRSFYCAPLIFPFFTSCISIRTLLPYVWILSVHLPDMCKKTQLFIL